MVIRDPVPEVQFHGEEVDMRILLHARHARKNDIVMHSDTLTLTLMSVLLLAHSKNLILKRCYMKKGRGANFLCNSTQAMLTTTSWWALIGVNLITGCDNISAFFGIGKSKAVQLLQWMVGTCELWRVLRERVISIQWELKIQHTEAPVCVNCTERSGMVWMCLLRDLCQD